MRYYGEKKPKAIVEHMNYWDVHLDGDSAHRNYETEAEALAEAERWEKEATLEWEENHSREKRIKERNHAFYFAMQKMVEEMKTDSSMATRRGDDERSACLKEISARIREKMKED